MFVSSFEYPSFHSWQRSIGEPSVLQELNFVQRRCNLRLGSRRAVRATTPVDFAPRCALRVSTLV